VVEVSRRVSHPLYKRIFTKKKKYHVHDELGVKEGDIVRFVETRPISKTKKWKIVEKVSSS
jgi:small subunit ribosomal protein S17